jgi:hypothetical protein
MICSWPVFIITIACYAILFRTIYKFRKRIEELEEELFEMQEDLDATLDELHIAHKELCMQYDGKVPL